MIAVSSDRNLLLGILALQMDFITRDALIDAMHAWTMAKSRQLSDILVERCELDPTDRKVLESLVDRHIARHGGDAKQSLSSIEPGEPVRAALEPLEEDPELHESLSQLGKASTETGPDGDKDRTASYAGIAEETGGRYQILRLHDQGGLGSVFLAIDREVNREVALKQLKEDNASDPQSRARFLLEAEITGNLEHPGIVPVYGKGQYDDGRPYYAMRFVRGETFKAAIDRFHKEPASRTDPGGKRREFQKLLRRFLVVCETMAYAHNRGVIHRDLKPRNILLGPYGETLIADWGLAKVVGRHKEVGSEERTLRPSTSNNLQPTLAGSHFGTPEYMSPEQARGDVERLALASDIYSLGVTLYYLLTDQHAFRAADPLEVIAKVERGEFRPPREVNRGVAGALNAICLKAMAMNPEDRYASCRALANDLEHWLADQPVAAYPEPLSTRAMRVVRRHKPLVAAAVGVVFLAFVGLAVHDRQLAAERAKTTEQLVLTRGALRELLTLAGNNLADIPNTERLRESLGKLVLKRYQELQKKFANDPAVNLESAQVYRVIAGIARITGQFRLSRESYDEALRFLTRLSDEHPDGVEFRRWLIETYADRGELLHMWGWTEESERDLRSAINRADRIWMQTYPNSYRRTRGSALINLSEILFLKDQGAEAVKAADEALELLETLTESARTSPNIAYYRWLYSLALTDRAIARIAVGDRMAASLDLDAAEGACKQMIEENPDNNDALYQLACICNQRAELFSQESKNHDDAKRNRTRAVEILEKLIRNYKRIPHYREQMAIALAGRAAIELGRRPQKLADAATDCSESQRLLESLLEEARKVGSPENPQQLGLLGRSLELKSRIQFARGDRAEGIRSLAQAEERLSRSIQLDPARVRDRAILEPIRTQLAGSEPK